MITPDVPAQQTGRTLSVSKPVVVNVETATDLSSQDPTWSTADAARLYGIDDWGQGYFAINEAGHLAVNPKHKSGKCVDLKQLVDDLRGRDLQPPILIRFADILQDRLVRIHEAFATAISDNNYRGNYRSVYPIKVNQQRHVVEEILDFGRPYHMGLEAGSKPELLAVLAMVEDDQTLIICNGFKDDEFIETVVLAAKAGKNIVPVVEQFSELRRIIKYAQKHQVQPRIGIRAKLATRGNGRWEQSGGLGSKFGLFSSEIVAAVQLLREQGLGDCLKLLHFHMGSQAPDIGNIKSAVTELARLYVELKRMGAALEYIDVGGGLGVDYDGSKSNYASSINYDLLEYASNIVFHIKEACDAAEVDHPTIVTESGRALVAYHSILVINVVGWSGYDRFEIPQQLPTGSDHPKPLVNLFDTYHSLTNDNYHEYYHDAQLAWGQTVELFKLGYCTLEERATAERLYFGICSKVHEIVRELETVPDDFAELANMLADTYFCNWSVFQSLPDSWAIDQLFPILPVHRLGERPSCKGILADITCDSDGQVDRFISGEGAKKTLELHPLTGGDYYLAVCMVGAYQEILGDLHNLFGDTNAVHVSLDDQGHVVIDEVIEGDRVDEVLHYVQYSSEQLMRRMRQYVERALRNKRITLEQSQLLMRDYESGLKGYTYLE